MKIVLFYATKKNEVLTAIQKLEQHYKNKGHTILCIKASAYLNMEYKIDLKDEDTIYGFAVSSLCEESKKRILLVAKMLKNEYVRRPTFIYSSHKKHFSKIQHQLQSILSDKNYEVIQCKVQKYDSFEMDQVIEDIHKLYQKYHRKRNQKKSYMNSTCAICKECTWQEKFKPLGVE